MTTDKISFVSVAGYGSTGSSAVVNLLEELSDCHVVGGEFRFIQDPDGLEDFCSNIVNSWGWVRSDAFVRRFKRFTDIMGRHPKYFEFGEDLDRYFNNKFFKFRDAFLNQVIDTTWQGYWFYHDYHERGPLDTFIEKCKRYVVKYGISKRTIRKITKKSDMYFVRHDVDIYKYASEFINKLFLEKVKVQEQKMVVLDQLILPYNRDKFSRLFLSLKQIIVDRDPRDVYLDAMTYNAYPITKDIKSFISFYESVHNKEPVVDTDVVKKIQFEDLIYNYDKTIVEIFSFLNINPDTHYNKKNKFNPEVSIKNTKTWRRQEFKRYRQDIVEIEKNLSQWCYD